MELECKSWSSGHTPGKSRPCARCYAFPSWDMEVAQAARKLTINTNKELFLSWLDDIAIV